MFSVDTRDIEGWCLTSLCSREEVSTSWRVLHFLGGDIDDDVGAH